jgi:hypothetical protein
MQSKTNYHCQPRRCHSIGWVCWTFTIFLACRSCAQTDREIRYILSHNIISVGHPLGLNAITTVCLKLVFFLVLYGERAITLSLLTSSKYFCPYRPCVSYGCEEEKWRIPAMLGGSQSTSCFAFSLRQQGRGESLPDPPFQ